MIDKGSPVPLYYQIEEDIISRIESGEFQENQKIDGEFAFMEKYGVSQITIRKALSELVAEGYLYRLRGKGTFVAEKRRQHHTSLSSFTQEMIDKGVSDETKILAVEEVCHHRVNKAMGLKPESMTIKVKRLRMADGRPAGIQTSYIPVSVLQLSDFSDFDQVRSLYAVFKRSHIEIARAKEIYRAVTIDRGATKDLLQANLGEAAFSVSRYGYTKDERLVEYTESILLGEKYELVTQT